MVLRYCAATATTTAQVLERHVCYALDSVICIIAPKVLSAAAQQGVRPMDGWTVSCHSSSGTAVIEP